MNVTLRLLAILSMAAVVVHEAMQAFPLDPRQHVAFVMLGIFAVLIPLAFVLLLREPLRLILGHADVIVPLLIVKLAVIGLGLLVALPFLGMLNNAFSRFNIGALAITLSVALVLFMAVWVFYGAWATTLAWRVARGGNADIADTLREAPGRFLRTLVLEAIGLLVLLGLLGVTLALARAKIMVGSISIGVLAVIWNFLTAPLLPMGLDGTRSIAETLARTPFVALAGLRRWGLPVLAQMLLLGLLTYTSVSLTEVTNTTERTAGGSTTTNRSVTRSENTRWSVNARWTGGYEDETAWDAAIIQACRIQPVAVVSTLLGLLFGVLAIGVKLDIMLKLREVEEKR
jgi:hypothetical protein